MAEQKEKPRHPQFAIPKHYDLKLKTEYSARIFTGAVKISVSVVSDTKTVVLDAVGLSVNPKSVSFASQNKVLKAVRVEVFKKEEAVVLEFEEKLPIGYGNLSMEFEATLNSRIKGFLRSTFKHNGEKKKMVETESMPAGARWCFPCLDEPHPHCKATMKITSEAVGWGFQDNVWLSTIVVFFLVTSRCIKGPPGGYWQQHFSDHPERAGYAVMAYTRPEVFVQYVVFITLANYAALCLLAMLPIGLVVGFRGWGWVWAHKVLLWISVSSFVLSYLVVSFDMRAMISLPLWLGIAAFGLHVVEKCGFVEEKKARVYEEEGVV